jgi:predicted transposase/invertase (TIGR01784 family)
MENPINHLYICKKTGMTSLKEKYINPFTDFGFKRIFGEEPNKDILIDFLNALFSNDLQINELTFKSPYKTSRTKEERKAVFDLYCITNDNKRVIIEMQKAKQKYFKDRSVYYSTFPIIEQAQTGDWDYRLEAVYTVGILDFCFNDEDKDKPVVSEVRLIDKRTQKVFYDKLTFIYLQMPNFTKTEKQLKTRFDKWLYVLKNLPKFEKHPEILRDRIFKKLFKISEIANFSKNEINEYENSLKVFRDIKNTLDTAREEGREEGEQIGIAKGEQIGIAKGEQIGIAKGEQIKAKKTALKLLRKRMPLAEIADITELSLHILHQLKELLDTYGDDAEKHLDKN